MQLLHLLPLAALALGIPFTQPRETGAAVAARGPAHAPMARRAPDAHEQARAHVAALAKAQAAARAEAAEALEAAVVAARQNGGGSAPNYEPLLHLASLAGIPLPTDPGVLLGLAPQASKLLQALPTGPVLTALETAAPSGFISRIVHDPSFALSFESAFAAGSSPSWFLNLPTSVRDYLHTYDGIVTVVGEVGTVIASVTKAEANSKSRSASASQSASQNGTASRSSTSRTGGIVATDTATAQQTTASAPSSSASAGAAAMHTPPAGAVGLSAMAIAAVLGAAVAM